MIGLALVTTMAIVGSSSKASIDKTIDDNFQGDLVVSNVVGERFSPSLGDQIERTPGVATVTRVRFAIPKIDGRDQAVTAVDPEALERSVRVTMVEGAARDLRDGSVLVGEKRASQDHLGLGDTVRMQMPEGARSYRVAGIVADNNPVLAYPFTLDPRCAGGRRLPAGGQPAVRGQAAGNGHLRPAATCRGGHRQPADRHGQGPGRLRRRAACPVQPAAGAGLRDARARPAHRGARHREHAGALGHRANPRGRAAPRHRAEPDPAAPDGAARGHRDRGVRCAAGRGHGARLRRRADGQPAGRGSGGDLGPVGPAAGRGRRFGSVRRARGRRTRPSRGTPRRAGRHRHRPDGCTLHAPVQDGYGGREGAGRCDG